MSTALAWAALAAVVVIAIIVARVEARRRRHQRHTCLLQLLTLFGPSVARVQVEPRELVAWSEVASAARTLFPEAFHQLDTAYGSRFPFSDELIESVHARWTTEWLAWERDHDLEFKRRSAELETQLEGATAAKGSVLRARLAEVEQEKLLRYQERYEEYVRFGKSIGALATK